MEQESRLNELRQKIEMLRNRQPQLTQLEEHMMPLGDAQIDQKQKGGEAYREKNGCSKVEGARELCIINN